MLEILELENFRNHRSLHVEFGRVTALLGKNGAGKSNILEAISVLSLCRSFRDDDKRNLVLFGLDFARVTSGELEVFIQKNPTTLLRAKSKGVAKKQSEFIGRLKTIIFSPETISLVTGSPGSRRKFLDMMISQNDRVYLRALMEYEKIRKQRNSLLEAINLGRSSQSELDFWDRELIEKGTILVNRRREAVAYLNKSLSDHYAEISGHKDKLEMNYITNIGDDFSLQLKKGIGRDLASGKTNTGPHRDDLAFVLNGSDMMNFASRGELRSAVLALKIAELEFLKDNDEGIEPILLLDDVFSEFDELRRSHLCKLISGYQTVITTTDKDHLSKELLKEAKIIEIINK